MSAHVKRFALLMGALAVVAVALVACQTPSTNVQSPGQNGVNVFHTPTPPAPTPTFPPFTIGAWPSNFSPNDGQTITIYVLCRVQDQSMNGPASPPAPGVSVNISVSGSGGNAVTGPDGLATYSVQVNSPAGQPVVVTVSATYQGKTYQNTTFYTPSPANAPKPTATPKKGDGGGNGGGGGSPATPPATPGQ